MYTYGITGTSINEFRDITLTAVANGQVLKYNSTTSQWENVDPSTLSISVDNLSDVVITDAEEFQVLEFDGTNWVNKHASVTTWARNVELTTLNKGEVVYIYGGNGDHATVKRADKDMAVEDNLIIGMVATAAAPNENCTVVTHGYVTGLDLSVGYVAGDVLWVGDNGGVTKTRPAAPAHSTFIGVVVRATNNGIVFVSVQNGNHLAYQHDVSINAGTLDDKDVLAYNNSTGLWENTEVSSLGITLGTDTTGNYVSGVSAGTGISVSHTPSEGSTATVSLSASLDNLSDVAVTSAAIGNTLVYTGSNFVNKNAFVANSYQTAVDERKVTQVGSFQTAVPGTNVGSATFVVFRNACEITELSVYLNATYTSATTYDYRLGIYNDDNGKPGSLLVDAGTVSIAQNATAGFKTITLGTAQSVSAGQVIWLVCAATHVGSVPAVIHHAGHIQPYSDYGLTAATHYQACCFAYTTGPATALPATFTLAATETQPVGVAVYAKVNIP